MGWFSFDVFYKVVIRFLGNFWVCFRGIGERTMVNLQCLAIWFAHRISKILARSLTNVDDALSANSASSAPSSHLCKIRPMDQKVHPRRVELPLCDHPNVAGGGRWPWPSECGIGIWPAIEFSGSCQAGPNRC